MHHELGGLSSTVPSSGVKEGQPVTRRVSEQKWGTLFCLVTRAGAIHRGEQMPFLDYDSEPFHFRRPGLPRLPYEP